jgi:hypothetical protein
MVNGQADAGCKRTDDRRRMKEEGRWKIKRISNIEHSMSKVEVNRNKIRAGGGIPIYDLRFLIYDF